MESEKFSDEKWAELSDWQREIILRLIELQPHSNDTSILKEQVNHLQVKTIDEHGCLDLLVTDCAPAKCSGMIAEARYPDDDTVAKAKLLYGREIVDPMNSWLGPHVSVMLFVNKDGYLYQLEFNKDDQSTILNRRPTSGELLDPKYGSF